MATSSPSRSVPRSDWTTSATRFTQSKLVGCARECPGQSARVCGRSADGGPLARATLKRPPIEDLSTRTRVKRPADRGSFTRTRVKRPADRGSFTRTRVKRLPIEDLSLDQSEKTCRSRIFPSGRGEETCRSRNFPTSRIPQQTFVLVLDRASTVTTVDSDVSDRGKHRGSLKYAQGGRYCTRVAESEAVAFALESPNR